MTLSGSTALVTGAGRGIGRAVALVLGADGARIGVCARTASEVHDVCRQIVEAGGSALPIVADMSTLEGAAAAAETAEKELGDLDILVNNAGGSTPKPISPARRRRLAGRPRPQLPERGAHDVSPRACDAGPRERIHREHGLDLRT